MSAYYDPYALALYPPMLEVLRTEHVTLEVRQQPEQALVMSMRNKKSRKPVDPPVVIKMSVSRAADSTQLFLHNPHIFAIGYLEYEDGVRVPNSPLEGVSTSSLHRMKDVDANGNWGPDCGFFVFGDVSISRTGTFRLHFHVYEKRMYVRKHNENTWANELTGSRDSVYWLQDIRTEPFEVVNQKDYTGLKESSFLTRALADQGVRARIRKDQRGSIPYEARDARDQYFNRKTDEKLSRSRPGTNTSPPDDALTSPASRYGGSPEKRREIPDDESYRSSKRSRTDLGPMFPGVNHNTRGWGAFNGSDLQAFSGPEGLAGSSGTTNSYSSRNSYDYMSHRVNNPYVSNMASQFPSAPQVVPDMRSPYEFVNENQYQTPFGAQQSAQQSSFSPPNRPPEHNRSQSQQSNLSSGYSLSRRQSMQRPQGYLGNPIQQPVPAFGSHLAQGMPSSRQDSAPFGNAVGQYGSGSALQTLATASQQQSYLTDSNLTNANLPATTSPEALNSLLADPTQRQPYTHIHPTPNYPRTNYTSTNFETTTPRSYQPTHRGNSAAFPWAGAGIPLVSAGGNGNRGTYGDTPR